MDTPPTPGHVGGIVLEATHGAIGDVAVGWTRDSANRTWIGGGVGDWRLVAGSVPRIETVASGPAGVLGLVGLWDAAGDEVTGFEVWQLVVAPGS